MRKRQRTMASPKKRLLAQAAICFSVLGAANRVRIV
jgi:hypothetical protein